MFQGLSGILDSKKAIAGGVLVICATVLVGLGKMTVADWQNYTQVIFMTYAGAETVNGVAATWKGTKREAPAAAPDDVKKDA